MKSLGQLTWIRRDGQVGDKRPGYWHVSHQVQRNEQRIMEEKTMNPIRELIIALGTLVESESHDVFERDGTIYPITRIYLKADLHKMEDCKALDKAIQTLLKNNMVNRPLDERYVKYFEAEILSGRWRNGLSVMKFSTYTPNGDKRIVLIGGQHRLYGFIFALKKILSHQDSADMIHGSIQIDLAIGYPLEDAPLDNRAKVATPGQTGSIDQKIHHTEFSARTKDFAIARCILLGPGAATNTNPRSNEVLMNLIRPYLPNTRLVDKAGGIEGFNTAVLTALLRWTAQPDFNEVKYRRFVEIAKSHLYEGAKESAPVVLSKYLSMLHAKKKQKSITQREVWIASYNATEIAIKYFIGGVPMKRFVEEELFKESRNKEIFPLPEDKLR